MPFLTCCFLKNNSTHKSQKQLQAAKKGFCGVWGSCMEGIGAGGDVERCREGTGSIGGLVQRRCREHMQGGAVLGVQE